MAALDGVLAKLASWQRPCAAIDVVSGEAGRSHIAVNADGNGRQHVRARIAASELRSLGLGKGLRVQGAIDVSVSCKRGWTVQPTCGVSFARSGGAESRGAFNAVRFDPRASLPEADLLDVLGVHLSDDELAAYEDYLDEQEEATRPLHQLAGYPVAVQRCPYRDLWEELPEERRPSRLEEVISWPMLLQLDSDERLGLRIGDLGRLYVFIRSWSEDGFRSATCVVQMH